MLLLVFYMWYEKWAPTDANVRSQASSALLPLPLHCTGKLRKLPRTAVNLYGQLIDRFIENSLIKARVFVLL